MREVTRLAVAILMPVAVVAAAGQQSAAAAPPTDPVGSESEATIPGGTIVLTDDTGTITVDVPATWTDVDTAPAGDRPFIEAAPDRTAFNETFSVPGVTYLAAAFTADTASAVQEFGLLAGCSAEESQPYDDGLFAGTHLIYTECGGGPEVEYHVIAANPDNELFTAVLQIQITAADQAPILQTILETFNMTPAAVAAATTGATTTTAAPATTTSSTTTTAPLGTFPMPTGEIPADWTALTDDTQTITLDVPSSWPATSLAPTEVAGAQVPTIWATTDAALFFPDEATADTYSVPGVIYRAVPHEPDTAARLARSSYNEECTPQPMQTYDDGLFVGHIQEFQGCGGSATRIVQVAASPPDSAFTALLLVQLTGLPDDAATLNALLSSFNRTGPGAGTSTTAAAGPTTTTAAGPTTTVAVGPTTTGPAGPTTTAGGPTTTNLLDQPSG